MSAFLQSSLAEAVSYCVQSKLCAHVCLSVCDSLLNEAQNHTTSTLKAAITAIGRLNLLTLPSHTQICLHMPHVRHITCTYTPVYAGVCSIRGQKFN